MSGKLADNVVAFRPGDRKEAIRQAVEIVRETGKAAALVICRDIVGYHTGGEDCFCDPRIIKVNEEGEIISE